MRQLFFSRQIIPNAVAQLTLLLIAGLAQADSIPGQGTWSTTLEPRDLDGNGVTDAYYDTLLDITWLADANYMGTSGWTLSGGGFAPNKFVDYLAGFAHLGVNTWRLPRLDNPNQGTTGGELAHLYGVTLGNVLAPNPGATLVNTGPFINLQATCYLYAYGSQYYWTATTFNMGTGSNSQVYCGVQPWAVADGDVQPVQVAAPAYEIVDLGTLGGSTSVAYDINNHGQIVGYATNAANVTRAFLYANGTMQDLGTLRADDSGSSVAYGINNLGQITGFAAFATPLTGSMGFLYSGGAMTPIGQVPVSSTNFDYIRIGNDINDNGDIAVTRHVRYPTDTFTDGYAGVLAANGTLSMMDEGGYCCSAAGEIGAISINSAGHMIGYGEGGGSSTIYYLLKDGQTQSLGYYDYDFQSRTDIPLNDINDNNQIASSYYRFQSSAASGYLVPDWSEGYGEIITAQPDNSISRTPVPGSHALYLINDGGDMVGAHNGRYFVRPANGPNFYLDEIITNASGWDLNSGAELQRPYYHAAYSGFYAMNDRGDFVGSARTTDGQTHAVLLRRAGPATTVKMDVDPFSTANEVLPSSDNPIVVAVLSTLVSDGDTVDFDATQVDPASLKFGLGEAPNVAFPWAVDVSKDGDTDMLFAFRTQDTGIFCGDTEVSLTGSTYAGELIRATDTIATTDCVDTGCHP